MDPIPASPAEPTIDSAAPPPGRLLRLLPWVFWCVPVLAFWWWLAFSKSNEDLNEIAQIAGFCILGTHVLAGLVMLVRGALQAPPWRKSTAWADRFWLCFLALWCPTFLGMMVKWLNDDLVDEEVLLFFGGLAVLMLMLKGLIHLAQANKRRAALHAAFLLLTLGPLGFCMIGGDWFVGLLIYPPGATYLLLAPLLGSLAITVPILVGLWLGYRRLIGGGRTARNCALFVLTIWVTTTLIYLVDANHLAWSRESVDAMISSAAAAAAAEPAPAAEVPRHPPEVGAALDKLAAGELPVFEYGQTLVFTDESKAQLFLTQPVAEGVGENGEVVAGQPYRDLLLFRFDPEDFYADNTNLAQTRYGVLRHLRLYKDKRMQEAFICHAVLARTSGKLNCLHGKEESLQELGTISPNSIAMLVWEFAFEPKGRQAFKAVQAQRTKGAAAKGALEARRLDMLNRFLAAATAFKPETRRNLHSIADQGKYAILPVPLGDAPQDLILAASTEDLLQGGRRLLVWSLDCSNHTANANSVTLPADQKRVAADALATLFGPASEAMLAPAANTMGATLLADFCSR